MESPYQFTIDMGNSFRATCKELSMIKFYQDGQVRRMFPHMRGIDWFILGGPADGNEAQLIKQEFPHVNVIGIEPNIEMYQFQLEQGFPGVILNSALWSCETRRKFVVPNGNNRCGSLVKYQADDETIEVETATLDKLSELYGPFDNCCLWLDIEDAELECLSGAEKLLSERRIKVINIEIVEYQSNTVVQKSLVETYLFSCGFKEHSRHDIRNMEENRVISDIIFTLG